MTSIFVSIPSPGGKFGERGNNWGVNGGVDGIKWPRCCKSCKSKDNATTISLLLLNRRTHQARVLCDFRDIYKKGWWLRGAYSLKNGWKAPNCRWPPSPPSFREICCNCFWKFMTKISNYKTKNMQQFCFNQKWHIGLRIEIVFQN